MQKSHIFDQNDGLTPENMEIHRIIGGYKELQRVPKGYKGLQGVTGNIPRYFFLVYLALKPKLKKTQIFDQNDGLTPLKKIIILRFS